MSASHPPGTVIACSLTDTMMADIAVSVVFFFERALDDRRLADGLAAALGRLPAFGGRLRARADSLEIICNGAGAPMSTFEAGEALGDAMNRVTLPGSGLVDHVDTALARSAGHPLLTVRASRLDGGGMALGCSWHHAVGDLQSFMLLMRTWSALVEGTSPPQALTVQDRDAYLDDVLPAQDSGRAGIRLLGADEAAGMRRDLQAAIMTGRTVQIYFSDAEASRMRQDFSAAARQRLSVNDVLCAHVVTTIRRLDEDPEARNLAIAVEIRRRLGLPPAVVGNLTSEIYLPCGPQAAPEQLAAQIRSAIADFAQSHLSIRASHRLLESIGRSRLGDCVPVGFDLRNRTFTFNSWSRFGLYDITFEAQRPVFFSPSPSVALPWTSWLVEGFGGSGFLFTVGVPARLAGRLRSPGGRAALHRFREPQDVLPALAAGARKVI